MEKVIFLQDVVRNMDLTDNNEKLIIEKDFCSAIKFFKENFYQDILESITVEEIADNKYELTYKTYSTVYEEDTNFYVHTEKEVESIKSLYKNASEIEDFTSTKYNITFV